MEPLQNHLPNPAGLTAGGGNDSTAKIFQEDSLALERGRRLARRLVAALAPLFPVVASLAKEAKSLDAVVKEWGRQITLARLDEKDLAWALSRLGQLDRSKPFSLMDFLELAFPSRDETRADWEEACRVAGAGRDTWSLPDWTVLSPLVFTTWINLSKQGINLRNASYPEIEKWHTEMCRLSKLPQEWETPVQEASKALPWKPDLASPGRAAFLEMASRLGINKRKS